MDYHIYTDGACIKNPGGAGGWGFVALNAQTRAILKKDFGGSESSTNNIMELMGILEAVKFIPDKSSAMIYTDSKYSMNAVTRWADSWERNGWRTKEGNPVKNKALIVAIRIELERVNVQIKWVKGHAGNKHNEIADELAYQGMKPFMTDKQIEWHEKRRYANG